MNDYHTPLLVFCYTIGFPPLASRPVIAPLQSRGPEGSCTVQFGLLSSHSILCVVHSQHMATNMPCLCCSFLQGGPPGAGIPLLPRASYKGVVSVRCRGRRLFIAPEPGSAAEPADNVASTKASSSSSNSSSSTDGSQVEGASTA
jgi:hypothetical protein